MFKPKLFTAIKGITKEQIISDITAGIIVGIIALPLAIAFGIASGVSPEKGLITAIIGGFLVSFLGGSRVQIGGPTGAFIIIVYQIIQEHGLNGLLIATIMAGVILIIMGFARLGT
ncbi:MAG: sodium-independent anion transporter, partial [Melioribacteraceae bacterium]